MGKYIFVVAGKGDFPFKCLWNAACWPASAADAHLIALSCPTVAPLQRIALRSARRPDPVMWQEENWPIQSIQS